MAATETLKLSPALQRFLEECSDEEVGHEVQDIPSSLDLGDLDISTTNTSLRGEPELISRNHSHCLTCSP